VAIIAAQLLVAVFLVWKFVLPEYQQLNDATEVVTEQVENVAEEEDAEPLELGVMYQVESLTVNPRGTRGMRFAIFEFSLEVPGEDEIQILEKYKMVLVDNYISYFRNQTMNTLADDTKIDSLKLNLANIANEVVGQKIVHNVYFTRFVLE